MKGCEDAVLVYPTRLETKLDARIGTTRVRTLAYDLGDGLEAAGRRFLGVLLSDMQSCISEKWGAAFPT